MRFEYHHEWIPISEKEYDRAYNKKCRDTDNELMNIMQEVLFNTEFRKDPIYKNPGIHNLMEENPEITGYEYYKRGGLKLYLVGSLEQIKEYDKYFNKMMLKEYDTFQRNKRKQRKV